MLRIGITLGDPRGIGPEVTATAARQYRAAEPHRLVLIGPSGTVADGTGDMHVVTGSWHAATDDRAAAGRLAGAAIDEAIRLALSGEIDAIVTAPIDKAALHAGGYPFPGHTEMLASRARVTDVVMMMSAERTALGGPLRVVLATTHMPLSQVANALTVGRLVSQTQLTDRGLRSGWNLPAPRIALCAFNPHASDGGLFGDEEARVYGPAMNALREQGIDVRGPVPADTVFLRAARGEFDAVVAPYHDVGMAAFKTAAFGSGVNVTLGLPFTRTSPDHGTALDIAGTGTADASSMLEAISLAARLAGVQHKRIPAES
ncbi:MAG: 4-hydroxythreonine-4-phosphate dehydrogenase PdxA [Gemmatimonadota bacterium]